MATLVVDIMTLPELMLTIFSNKCPLDPVSVVIRIIAMAGGGADSPQRYRALVMRIGLW